MNDVIAELITRKLIDGMMHPGDPTRGEEPTFIRLPFFPQAGMPAEVHEQTNTIVKTLAEALVHSIETEGDSEIVSKSEINQLREELAALKEETAQ